MSAPNLHKIRPLGQPWGAPPLGRPLNMRYRFLGHGPFGDGPGRESTECAHAVVHDNGAGCRHIKRKGCWNADQMLAAADQLRRELPTLGAEYIGRSQWMWKTRQVGGLPEDLDAHQATALRQAQRLDVRPGIDGQMALGARGVGAHLQGALVGANGEGEACAKGMSRPDETAEIDRLGNTLRADAKIPANVWK